MAVKATARATFYKREKGSYTFLRYSNDGGQTFTVASQAAIDAARGSLPLEGRNLLDASKIAKSINVSSLTVTNAATNTFNIVIGTANTIGRIQNIIPFVADTAKWAGRKYVLSGYIRTSVDATVRFDFGDINQKEAAINTTATSTYFTVTFNSTNYLTSPYYGFIDVNFPTAPTANISVYFDKLKLEVGEVASAFTPTNLINIENAEKNSWAGRNLLLNSGNFLNLNGWVSNGSTIYKLDTNNKYNNQKTIQVDGAGFRSSKWYNLSPNEEIYTYSVVIKSNIKAVNNENLPLYKWVNSTPTSGHNEIFVDGNPKEINPNKWTFVTNTFRRKAGSDLILPFVYYSANKSYIFNVACLKLEVGSTATPWTPAPEDCTFGTTEGEYMGTLVWDKPYPSNDPKDYTWGKVKGNDGKGIASVTEYYQVSSSATTAPTSWLTTPPATTATNRYLWNYEKITYTDGTSTETQKRVIGVYGDTGKGILGVTNYYLATTAGSGVTTSTAGWTTAVQAVTATSRYLWNYEVISYTDGTSTTVAPHIIGVWGDTGAPGKDAMTVRLVPDRIVVDTDDNGTVTSAALANAVATIDVRKGDNAYDAFIGSCSASDGIGVSTTAKTVKIESIAKDPSTVTAGDQSSGYAYASGWVDVTVIVDGKWHIVRLTVETNIHKVVAKFREKADSIEASVISLTQQVGDNWRVTDSRLTVAEGKIGANVTALTNLGTRVSSVEQTAEELSSTVQSMDSDLGQQISEISQKADSISLKVSETVLAGNMLLGTMFRREEEVTWNNASYKGVVSTSVQHEGMNSVYLESTSTAAIFKGVKWANVKVVPGKTYNMSFWYHTPDAASNGEMWMEMRGYKADGSATSPSQPCYAKITSFVANTWVKCEKTFTAPQDLASVSVMIYLVTKGKMYIARPMLIEGSYVGWQRSEQDYDYIGGNLLDETKTMVKRGNLTELYGTVTKNAFGFCPMVYAKATTGYKDFILWTIPYDLNADYTLSFMAKGTGNLDVYLFNDNLDVSLFSEFTGHQRNTADGNATLGLTPEWKKHTVRWRTKSARTLSWAYVLFRVFAPSEAYIAQPKLEKGCVATEWTEGDGDMVSAKALLATGVDVENRKVTITADNVQVQNNSGETTMLLNVEGKIQAKLIEADKVSAWQVAQPFEEYASKDAFLAGESLSWVIRNSSVLSGGYLGVGIRWNGVVLNIYNATTANISFTAPVTKSMSQIASYGDGNTIITVVLPPGGMFRALCVVREVMGSQQPGLYVLVPFTRSGNTITIKSFEE